MSVSLSELLLHVLTNTAILAADEAPGHAFTLDLLALIFSRVVIVTRYSNRSAIIQSAVE
jgi:hypothetical protein